MPRTLRPPLLASLALVLLVPVLPVQAQTAPRPVQTAEDPWLYKGSDLVHDDEWKFGRLSNGVRYAVRKNGVPPGQVSVRVRIDAGSLNEQESERGFAHLLEHLSFRGSTFVPDGESKRIWQRLGVTFGSDSNASTTFTQTVYKLDLPTATAAGLDESFKILAGMMAAPAITQASLTAERPVVLAEAREQPGAQERLQDTMLGLMFAGQPVANRKPIGTTAALTAATAETVQAFHDRWYRPERAVVIVIGDMDPTVLEAMVQKHFASWRGKGPNPASPDFGKPVEGQPVAASIVESAVPPLAMMTIVRPWTVFSDTVIFNQKRMIDLVAVRIINRRLETRARSGGSFLAAGADLSDVARSANVTTVNVMPVGADWETALRDVRGVIADAQTSAPTQAEIDRELAEIESSMKQRIATAPVESGMKLADDLVEAVDINETVTTPEASYDIFKSAVAAKMFTPETVQAASKRVFEGTAVRALVNTHTPDPQLMTKVTAALQADVAGSGARRKALGDISFAQLPKLGAPGKMVSRTTLLPELEIEKVVFANGVNLLMRKDSTETGKVYVNVRFGGGLNALPADRPSPAWAGEMALTASGIGKLGQEELDALIGRRQMGFDFDINADAFRFGGQTNKEDLPDQLRLFATKLAAPAWDPNPVTRAKTAVLSGYAGLSSSPDAVLGRDLEKLLHSGDPRWGIPERGTIEATTPASFRKLWAPLLASGPIEVEVFGDMDSDATIKAVAETFGALKPRPARTAAAPAITFPAHVDKPVVRLHTGKADQAAAVIAWPTGAGSAGITESRKLEVLAAIFRDRLIDQLRSQAGVSYSPNVASQWPLGLTAGGKLIALGMVPPDKTDFFFQLARGIAADLVAKPVDADELTRALTPIKQQLIRQSSGNMFWMRLVEGGSYDQARVDAVDTLARDVALTSPAEVQALAAKYLQPSKDWSMVVMPGPDAKAGG
ncbi:zinc protease [Sphingomonas naasensis]|uniref:Insulinase family protein n=1 Tax=Sphingomonas naasensis TaxID=1344951 RepID=A0A4S1W856_9SPHN|nr:insulinase family protein [Sphingomonas naasensis]NIJ19983.1 zinc protease [Sphingomonas naasensis]TGX37935.1 insulinase family protein [Sphingomonas naasensis]